jgi:TolB-like protein/class 3 adenylate cyclase
MGSGERRLAAIVVADVVGYSRMMAGDEDGTLSALQAHLNIIEPVILNSGGRVVKRTGDGMLVEFSSAVAALGASIEVQELMQARNQEIPEPRRMQFRLGINVGDVVIDDTGDLFGDGVNVAARVEAAADPGGISVTDAVYQAVIGKLDIDFTDDGEHDLKNIERPVKLWKVGQATISNPSVKMPATRNLAVVAVLPFDNMSGDVDQEYFADGIMEDLLTALSYNKDLAVIARNSSFAYKGRATDIRTIARKLDATHIVEGSVRRSGDRVRVTAQLIDAESGHHIWAERYDKELTDIFDLQDELVAAITAKLTRTFWDRAATRVARRESSSFDAWDLTIRGQFLINTFKEREILKGLRLFDEARELEPGLVGAVARSSLAWSFLAWSGWRDEQINPWQRAQEDAETAYQIDPDDYVVLSAMALSSGVGGRLADGVRYSRRMIDLNPYGMFGHQMLGNNLDKAGDHVEAVAALTEAWRLGSHEPFLFDVANDLAHAHYMEGNYEPALMWGEKALILKDDYLQIHLVMAAILAQLGRVEDGQQHVAAVLDVRPNFSCAQHRPRLAYSLEADRDQMIEGLVKAGLPG